MGKHATRSVLGTLIQMYNQMVNTGVRFGYIYTAVALVFCHIPLDDPSLIQYYLCAPAKDVRIVGGWESNWVRRTALGQVPAFTLHSLAVDSPPQTWYDTDISKHRLAPIDFLTNLPIARSFARFTPPIGFEYITSWWATAWEGLANQSLSGQNHGPRPSANRNSHNESERLLYHGMSHRYFHQGPLG